MESTAEITISVKGRAVKVPAIRTGNKTIIAAGRFLRIAQVRDEDWLEGDVVDDPEACAELIRQQRFRADIFTFVQKLPNPMPKYRYPMQWENVAAIPTTDYQNWWEHRVSQAA